MTQELISNMPGVRREDVTEAAGKLQRLGIIQFQRGHITLLEPPTLDTLCRECYEVVKRETDRLIPTRPPGFARISAPGTGPGPPS